MERLVDGRWSLVTRGDDCFRDDGLPCDWSGGTQLSGLQDGVLLLSLGEGTESTLPRAVDFMAAMAAFGEDNGGRRGSASPAGLVPRPALGSFMLRKPSPCLLTQLDLCPSAAGAGCRVICMLAVAQTGVSPDAISLWSCCAGIHLVAELSRFLVGLGSRHMVPFFSKGPAWHMRVG